MATSVNIGGGDDQFNRYKMPPVIGKVEGRGNGIKTRIVNCYEVARALHRPPGYVCKFFGCELGAQTKIDDAAGVYIVNGSFNQAVLSETLQNFIKMFVLCGNCNLPETDLKIKKNGDIKQACNACGAETMCDMQHKLCTYITNNPPDGKKKKSDGKGKADKAERRARKAAKEKEKEKASTTQDAVELDGDSHDKDRRKAEKAARKAAKKSSDMDFLPANDMDFTATMGLQGDVMGSTGPHTNGLELPESIAFATTGDKEEDDEEDDGVQWSVDTSKEAQEARMRELGAAAAILERGSAVDEESMALKLRAYIDDGKKASKVISKAEKIFGKDQVIYGIMSASIIDESRATIPKSMEERAVPVLAQFGTPMDAESQRELCDYFDDIASRDNTVLPVLPHMLKTAFDGDLLEEEVIFKWYKKEGGREDVRQAVKVIIEWLENAEEESDDDDEEESEEE